MSTLQQSVVIDTGSHLCKAGFGGYDAPHCIFPSLVKKPRYKSAIPGITSQNMSEKERFVMKCPIERGLISNWDDMEKLWHHIFYNELRISPEECPVLLTEPPLNPKSNREKITETMFEYFEIPSIYIGNQAVLSLISVGLSTGLVLESGDGSTHTVPIYEGHALPHATLGLNFGGNDLTLYMMKLLDQRGYSLNIGRDVESLREIKETICRISLDYQSEMKEFSKEIPYELPDGTILSIGNECIQCTEALFQPNLLEWRRWFLQKYIQLY